MSSIGSRSHSRARGKERVSISPTRRFPPPERSRDSQAVASTVSEEEWPRTNPLPSFTKRSKRWVYQGWMVW